MVYADKPNSICQHYGYDMNAGIVCSDSFQFSVVPSYQRGLGWSDKSVVKHSYHGKSNRSSFSSSDYKNQCNLSCSVRIYCFQLIPLQTPPL